LEFPRAHSSSTPKKLASLHPQDMQLRMPQPAPRCPVEGRVSGVKGAPVITHQLQTCNLVTSCASMRLLGPTQGPGLQHTHHQHHQHHRQPCPPAGAAAPPPRATSNVAPTSASGHIGPLAARVRRARTHIMQSGAGGLCIRVHARTHARTHVRTHARTHACICTRPHAYITPRMAHTPALALVACSGGVAGGAAGGAAGGEQQVERWVCGVFPGGVEGGRRGCARCLPCRWVFWAARWQ